MIRLYNTDFWWHIANGKYISENHSLPEEDPFTYTDDENPSQRKSMILKGYWLAQLVFSEIYNRWDAKGIIVLRSFLLTLFLAFVLAMVRQQGASFLLSMLMVSCVFVTAKQYGGERPQLFTFVVFAATHFLLDDFRIRRSRKIWLIPFMVMILSNMHPGYIVCILLISLYVVGEGMERFLRKEHKYRLLSGFIVLWVVTIICSMFNPLGGFVITRIFSFPGEYTRGIVEFMPTFNLYKNGMAAIDYPYIAFLLLSIVGLRYWKKIGLTHIVVLAIFAAMSFAAIRFVIFFMSAAAPVIARTIMYLKEEKIFNKSVMFFRRMDRYLHAATAILGFVFVLYSLSSLAHHRFSEETGLSVPKGAVDFLKKVRINGRMFNEYGFGGYLIWRLYPEKKVFIDGRVLDMNVLYEYNAIASADSNLGKTWKDLLEGYDITHVVMPPLRPNGDIYPLVENLFVLEDWSLIYYDHLALIFLRKGTGNDVVLESHIKEKDEGLNTIIVQAAARAMKNKNNPHYFTTLGKVFYQLGRYDDAKKAFIMASKIVPDDVMIRQWLERTDSKLH